VKGWKKIYQASVNSYSHIKQRYFKQKLVRRDKEGNYILKKGMIQQENITILNIYTLNISASKFTKQTLLSIKEQIGPDTIIVGDLNTPLSSVDRISRQKIDKNVLQLNNTMDEMDINCL
jgi:hypothetical protein